MSIPDLLRFEKPRKGQDKMIRDMRSALSQAKSIILNAPTGMGKTDASLAASIPVAMEKDLTVIFLTPKTSQHRIVVDALQGINRKFGYGIQYVDMVGKRNLCVNEKVNGIDSDAFYLACNEAVKKGKCIFYKRARDKANITSDIAALLLLNVSPLCLCSWTDTLTHAPLYYAPRPISRCIFPGFAISFS